MSDDYAPMMPKEHEEAIRAWHDRMYGFPRSDEPVTMTYFGRRFVVPSTVFTGAGVSNLLGQAVLDEVKENDRVLDMGTGCGVQAILAASRSPDVVAADINPDAVECTRHNAELNGVASRVHAVESDVFGNVEGTFDLIVFNPPFRWFPARDLYERSITDENYAALTTFFRQVRSYLAPEGRLLMLFGTSGDIDYMKRLSAEAGFAAEILGQRDMSTAAMEITYYTFRFTVRT